MNIQQNTYKIQHITAEQAHPLRARVLRPGQPIENCRYNEDHLPTTFHLGVFIEDKINNQLEDKIVCNGTFMKDISAYFPDEASAYRLRGMATDPDYRGLQLGSSLLNAAEDILRQKNCRLLWFNAREAAFPFYEKNGFQYIGDMFDIATIGPHKVMYKYL